MRSAVIGAALLRVRPIMMTVAAIIAGLLPSCLAVAPALNSCDKS